MLLGSKFNNLETPFCKNNPVTIVTQTSSENSLPPQNIRSSPQLVSTEQEDAIFSVQKKSHSSVSWWQKKSIRWKTTLLAIAIGTIPTIALGFAAYSIAHRAITREITAIRKTLALELENEVNLFMRERFRDIQIMAALDIFIDPQFRDRSSTEQKAAALERIQATSDVYNSIGIFDLQGNVIAQTGDVPLGNHSNRGYFQAVLETDSPVLSQPRISTSSGIYSVYAAAPIKDRVSGKTIAVIRARIPVAVLAKIIENLTAKGDRYYLLDETGAVFLSSAGDFAIQTLSNDRDATREQTENYETINIEQIFSGITPQLVSDVPVVINSAVDRQDKTPQFVVIAPTKPLEDLPNLNWKTLIATDASIIFAPQRRLKIVYTLGTLAIAIIVGIVAYRLADLATRPILKAGKAVEEIGAGNLKARIQVRGQDEIAQLANNINLMATQIDSFVREQQISAQKTEIIKQTVLSLNNVLDSDSLWEIVVTQARLGLDVEGVFYYSLVADPPQIIAESSVVENSLLGRDICEPEFVRELAVNQESKILAIDCIREAKMSASQREKLAAIPINKVAIAKIEQQGELIGLLMASSISSTQPWQPSEIDFLAQIANQIQATLDRLNFLKRQKETQIREKQAKEDLQQRAFELLQQVDRISRGDLTIRAKVTEDEIGTIADSYNATVYSLHKLVTQVKDAANQVEATAGNNQAVIQQLATDAVEQARSIAFTMQQIKKMTNSIDGVSQSATQAEQIVRQANETILASDTAMNRAVSQINAIQSTVSETEQKAKLLGESSQEISQVVNSIGRFAAQTHLLALKASIEAARAGEQGKGFATIADEVRSLANQSATATTDIENIVARIQLETNELVSAMARGTEQVSLGTELVEQTRQGLTRVTSASQEISHLIAEITRSARGQSKTSHEVSQNISQVALSAQANSQSATEVSLKIEQLLTLANKLQTDIDRFKT